MSLHAVEKKSLSHITKGRGYNVHENLLYSENLGVRTFLLYNTHNTGLLHLIRYSLFRIKISLTNLFLLYYHVIIIIRLVFEVGGFVTVVNSRMEALSVQRKTRTSKNRTKNFRTDKISEFCEKFHTIRWWHLFSDRENSGFLAQLTVSRWFKVGNFTAISVSRDQKSNLKSRM